MSIIIVGIFVVWYLNYSKSNDIHSIRLKSEEIQRNYFDGAVNLPDKEKTLLLFLMKKMSSDDMEIYTNYKDREGGSETIATGKDVLSESHGIFLLYLINRNERKVFDSVLSIVIKDYWLQNNTISWLKKTRFN